MMQEDVSDPVTQGIDVAVSMKNPGSIVPDPGTTEKDLLISESATAVPDSRITYMIHDTS